VASLRFSLGHTSSEADVDAFLAALPGARWTVPGGGQATSRVG
jgi:selenocysteine lyase/cysteine desulfurase